MKRGLDYQNPFVILALITLSCGLSCAFTYFDSNPGGSNLEILSFSNESSDLGSIAHTIEKRDAYETLRDAGTGDLSSLTKGLGNLFGGGSGDDKIPTMVNRRLYNSSVAITVPMFSFKLPHLTGGGFLVNQAIYGIFAWAVIALTFGMSFLFTGGPPESSRELKLLKSASHSHFNFMGTDFSQSLGMDGMQCLQKVICQAHRAPENQKYGVLASSVRMIFPAPANASLTTEESAFQTAARNGRYSDKNCENLYDCLVDPLSSARYLAHWYGTTNGNARYFMRMIMPDNYLISS